MENHEKIYEKTKNNSIGQDKKAPAKRTKKSIATTISISLLIMTLASSGLAHYLGVSTKKTTIDNQPTIEMEYKNEYNGYKDTDIIKYGKARAKDLLEEYGFTEYTMVNGKRDYHYTSEEYKEIDCLDNNYLRGLYTLTTEQTFNKILKSLGYENLELYLISNKYVDENGEPSVKDWTNSYLEQLSIIMKNICEEKGLKK